MSGVAEVNTNYLAEMAESTVAVGYKQTEVGLIPEDWEVVPIGSLCTIFGRIGFRGYTKADIVEQDQGVLSISPSNILQGTLDFDHCTYISWSKYHESPEIQIFNGDVLLVKTGSTYGKVGLVSSLEREATLNPQVVVLKKVKCPSPLLSYVMQFELVQNQIEETIVGGAIPTLSQKAVANYLVPIPKKHDEQAAIANALSDVDALISVLEKLISKKQAIKTATMQQLLTGRTRLPQFSLREDGSKKGYEPSELGEIPEDWDAVKMEELAKIQRGASPRPIDNPIWFERNSTVGWLRISDVSKTNKYLTETTQSLSELGIANSRFVAKNNLVMSICATVGKPIITKKDLCIHDGFVVLNGLSVDQDYMYYILKELEDEWGKQGQTGSQMNLNTELINGTHVAIPQNAAEQTAIANILSDMDKEIQALKQRLNKTKSIKQGMMQELLTGRTRLI
ncbi:restriction endonuclease subunit S [Kangiella marina]|uniref:Restriction endonuclease subunit S n=1 Tax=Kangiella marina TaxID=1079178 RepID=A0ABP8IDL4_9GAMM